MTVKLADDYAAINANLERIQTARREAIAGELPVVHPSFGPMYGGLDPDLAQGVEADGWATYHAADWDPA